MQSRQLAVATRGLSTNLKKALELAAKLPARGVQIDTFSQLDPSDFSTTAQRHLLSKLREYDLALSSLMVPLRKGIHETEGQERRLAAIRDSLALAGQLKVRSLCLRAPEYPDIDDENVQAEYIEILDELSAFGERQGVTLCLGGSLPTASQLRRHLQHVTAGQVRFEFDPAYLVAKNQNLESFLRSMHDCIGHVLAVDLRRDVGSQVRNVSVGTGEVDWDEVLALLHEAEYRDWITIEPNPGPDAPDEANRSLRFLSQYIHE